MTTNYKCLFTLNQFAVVKNGLDLDFTDLAIFDFIKDFAHSESCEKTKDSTGSYFWVRSNLIIQHLPIMNIKTDRGITKRIDKLIKAGLIKRHPKNSKLNKTLYCFGKNYDMFY